MLSSEKVPDLALKIVWNTIMNMLSARPDIHSEMVRQGTLFGVLAESQVLTNMPECQDLYTQFPGTDWNQRARGLGATGFIPLTSASEENILCYRTDRWRGYDGDNVMVHEFAHSIMNLGIVPIQPDFLAKLSATYDAAVAADLWLVPSPPPTYMNTGRKASNHISTPISIPPTQYTITLIPEKNFGNTIPGCSSF